MGILSVTSSLTQVLQRKIILDSSDPPEVGFVSVTHFLMLSFAGVKGLSSSTIRYLAAWPKSSQTVGQNSFSGQ